MRVSVWSRSVAVPARVTVWPSLAAWAGPASTVGGVLVPGTSRTVTVTVSVEVSVPSLTLRVKVKAVSAATCGAVKIVVSEAGSPRETVGLAGLVWNQL